GPGDEVKHFDKKDANIYVFDKGKYVVLEYKPLSDDAEARYYTYEFKDKKAYYNKDFNAKAYYQSHEPDYKEENMY
ncbi:MAG: cystatin-like fold lipoprotein, partial [Staphylococcus epidermidis]|nr:cystatin-like fold lipoprotein [Staphylococcus epidermidis]